MIRVPTRRVHVLCVCRVHGVFSFPHTPPQPRPMDLAHLTTLMHLSTLDALNTPLNRPLNAT
jgi:hypothetical protein